jgi:hypothetical protein
MLIYYKKMVNLERERERERDTQFYNTADRLSEGSLCLILLIHVKRKVKKSQRKNQH